ncbi:MAG: helix-turn-helix domain-containing protein [Anaerolineae bacterium]
MAEELPEYLTVEEACALLGVKRATLYAYVSRGTLRSYKQGIRRQRLYRRSDIEALLTVRPGASLDAEQENELPLAADWVEVR